MGRIIPYIPYSTLWKIKAMFETTNQYTVYTEFYIITNNQDILIRALDITNISQIYIINQYMSSILVIYYLSSAYLT